MKSCIVVKCDNKYYCKNFCKYHYNQFHKGWWTEDGVKTDAYNGRYPREEIPICKMKYCYARSTRRKFCNRHYRWLLKGNCDENGNILKKVRPRYGMFDICKVSDCNKKTKKVGFCNAHYSHYYRGNIDINGKNTDKKKIRAVYNKSWRCIICNKKDTRYVLGFCQYHYKKYHTGKIDFYGKPIKKYRQDNI